MMEIMFPFEQRRDETAFRELLRIAPTQADRDAMIQMHNRRDPATGLIRAEDMKKFEWLTLRILRSMADLKQRGAKLVACTSQTYPGCVCGGHHMDLANIEGQ